MTVQGRDLVSSWIMLDDSDDLPAAQDERGAYNGNVDREVFADELSRVSVSFSF